MRSINLIVVHCSATRADHALTTENLESEHRRRGFHGIGYHYYIRRGWHRRPHPPPGTDRGTCQRAQRPFDRYLL